MLLLAGIHQVIYFAYLFGHSESQLCFFALQPRQSVLSHFLISSVTFSLLPAYTVHSSLNMHQENHSVVLEIICSLEHLMSEHVVD